MAHPRGRSYGRYSRYMSTQRLYDQWSGSYDEVENKTRDLEKIACESILSGLSFMSALELGSGTGKNTLWLAEHAASVVSVDLSAEMQAVARAKVVNTNVEFRLGDVRAEWDFASDGVDLITCSLILEHIEDLAIVFQHAGKALNGGGYFYVCELHPFKQYAGSKARFEQDGEIQVIECFTHHVSDYTNAAAAAGLRIASLNEWFDDDDRSGLPRLISFLFEKNP